MAAKPKPSPSRPGCAGTITRWTRRNLLAPHSKCDAWPPVCPCILSPIRLSATTGESSRQSLRISQKIGMDEGTTSRSRVLMADGWENCPQGTIMP